MLTQKTYQSIAGRPSMGTASGEGVGGRRAPGELQAESADVEGEDGGVESDEDTGDQIRRGSPAAPQSRHPDRREQSHVAVVSPRARRSLQSSDSLPTAFHLHLLRHRFSSLQSVQRITHLRQ